MATELQEEKDMRKEREALLIATLAGLLIVGAAAFVVQPTLGGSHPQTRIQFSTVAANDAVPLRAGSTVSIFRTV